MELKTISQALEKYQEKYLQTKSTDLKMEAEKSAFMQCVNNNQELKKCTIESLQVAWLSAGQAGLSFVSSMNEVYLVPIKGQALMWPSPYGIAKLAMRGGVIEKYEKPIIVFKGESAEVVSDSQGEFINHTRDLFGGHTMADAVGVYMYFWANGKRHLSLFTSVDIDSWTNPNTGKNKARQSPGMLKAKCIKHTFNSMPKFVEAVEKMGLKVNFPEDPIEGLDYETGEYEDVSNQAPFE